MFEIVDGRTTDKITENLKNKMKSSLVTEQNEPVHYKTIKIIKVLSKDLDQAPGV